MKLTLAPIQGTTNATYRNLFDEIFGGIDTYYAPFIGTTRMRKTSSPVFKDLDRQINKQAIDLIPQLLGNNSDDFIYFSGLIHQMGYSEINWNIGCPFPTVTKKKKGSGILPYPNMIESFLNGIYSDALYKNGGLKLSVKIRLGLDSHEEGPMVIDVLNKFPISDVTIHGRTGQQKYTGTVNLDHFEELYQASVHPVVYNGDIFSVEDFKKIQSRFSQIDTFMLARGALANPFLPSEIKGASYSSDEKRKMLIQFHDAMFTHYQNVLSGDKHLLDKMKEFWYYVSQPLDPSGKSLKKIKKCQSIAQYYKIVDNLLSN